MFAYNFLINTNYVQLMTWEMLIFSTIAVLKSFLQDRFDKIILKNRLNASIPCECVQYQFQIKLCFHYCGEESVYIVTNRNNVQFE